MWFADIGLGVAWLLLAGWLLVAVTLMASATSGRPGLGRLLAPHARVPVLVGTGAVTVLFATQAGLVDTIADLPSEGYLDESVWAWFVAHRTPVATGVMSAVSTAGGTAEMAVLAVIGAASLWRARRRGEAAIVLGAAVGAEVLVNGFKNLYERARPPAAEQLIVETNFALPSGHALGSMVVLGTLAAAVVLVVRRPAARIGAVVVAAAGIVTIGVSRLYLGVHWMTDVLTGWLLGASWLALCVTALVLLTHRSRSCTDGSGTDATAESCAEGTGERAATPPPAAESRRHRGSAL